jgi:hypothetical protein
LSLTIKEVLRMRLSENSAEGLKRLNHPNESLKHNLNNQVKKDEWVGNVE